VSGVPDMPPPLSVHALVDTLGPGGAEFLLADFAAVAPEAAIELSVAALKPLASPVPAADRLRAAGLEPTAVPVTKMVDPRALARVRAHLADVRPALVHTHLGTADFLGGLAARSLRIPCVTTIHADWFGGGRSDRMRAWLSSRARRHCADLVIAVSDSARSAYLSAWDDRPEHLIVVRNGIADRAQPGSGAAIRAELGLRPDDLVVTAVSALRPEKNFEAAIDAVGLLSERFPRLRLVIAGDGPHSGAVEARSAPHQDRVVLPGHREDVMELLDATDVLVHPSHFDAFPTTLLEAMSASVPVVATNVGGMPEILEPGISGVLFDPPADASAVVAALTPLLDSAELRRRLGSAGRQRFEREFTASAWVRRIRGVYDRVLSERAASD
jgi:glycosyltransferase involved in cell wall biosynthesis